MKRIKSACILQTLVFSQKEDTAHTRDMILSLNRGEFENYKRIMERRGTRYQILDEAEQPDGSLVVHVRKQYGDRVDVSEYFG